MTAHATTEATRRYAERFAGRAAAEHFREAQGLVLSSIGIGTYLGDQDPQTDGAYADSVEAAVQAGINVIDTAINYRFQRSERSIGDALKRLAPKGFAREELLICTKGGYLTPDGAMPVDPNEYIFREYIQAGVLRAADIAAGCHAMTPRYLENQLERSLQNLGVDCVDVYYLHNPETQLGEMPRKDFLARVRAAFEWLEGAARAGKIRFYGMATWNGFRQPCESPVHMELSEFVALASEIAGEKHRFRFVQLPFNLAMTEALTLGNQPMAGQLRTMMETAGELGISLIGSAALLQGQVARNLPGFVREAFGLATDAESALQFARSAPGITTALVGMSHVEHVRANAKLVGVPPATVDQFAKLFTRGKD
ncbi:MAG: aldo/keto reductase [Candidatus Acidiferrales bacterium]|jgi:aryl-alcohol dehydrogenase-like predicted oxidoreductase